MLKSFLCYIRPDKMSLIEKNIKVHFINVRTVKIVIRERDLTKMAQKKKNAFYQREITQGVNGHI